MAFAFKLDITGNLAAQLTPINRGLAQTDAALGTAAGSAHRFDTAIQGVAKQSGALATIDLVGVFRAVADAIGFAIGKTIELGKWFIRTAADAQDLALATRFAAGSDAGQTRRLAQSFGVNTGQDPREVQRALLPFLRSGIRDQGMLDDIATAASDIEAMTGGGVKFEQAITQLRKTAVKRTITDDALEAFGLNVNDFFGTLSTRLGVSVKRAKEMAQEGKITGDALIKIVLESVGKAQGGALGKASLEAGKTLGASLGRLERLPSEMFEGLSESPAAKGIQETIDGIVTAFKGPAGARVMATIGKGFDRLLGGLSEENVVTTIEKTIDVAFKLADAIGVAASATAAAWNVISGTFRFIGEAVGNFVGFVYVSFNKWIEYSGKAYAFVNEIGGKIVDAIMFPFWTAYNMIGNVGNTILDLLTTWPKMLLERAFSAGESIPQGIRDGIAAGINGVVDSVKELGNGVIETVRDMWDSHSPSGVGEAIGYTLPQGIAIGIRRGLPDVEQAQRSLALPGAMDGTLSGMSAAGSGGGVVIHQSNEYRIEGGGDPEEVRRIVHEQQQISNLSLLRLLAVEAAGAEV